MELDKLRKVTRSPAQNLAAERARLRGAERIRESDDEVRRNLPDDLALVWAKVKGRIKGTARTTRTERFLDWVHDHPADSARIINDAAEQAYPQEEDEAAYFERQRRTRELYERDVNRDPEAYWSRQAESSARGNAPPGRGLEAARELRKLRGKRAAAREEEVPF